MNGSQGWKATKYIENFVQSSLATFKFEYRNLIAIAVFRSIVSLKKYGASREYLEEYEGKLLTCKSVFEYYLLMAHHHVNNLKGIDHIISCEEPLECGLLHEVFLATTNKLVLRLQVINPQISYQTLIELLNDVDDACKILLFNFLDIVKEKGASPRMEEELLFIEEIESLKNRKDKYHERDDSSG
jgi:hypothetical protein